MQQALAASEGPGLLALEALLLEEYDEVLVLDQKVRRLELLLQLMLAAPGFFCGQETCVQKRRVGSVSPLKCLLMQRFRSGDHYLVHKGKQNKVAD